MNVASLELCKELYELSDWDETSLAYYADGDNSEVSDGLYMGDLPCVCPAYDVGYLMERLPEGTQLTKRRATQLNPDVEPDYSAMLPEGSGYLAIDYTPEDALCKLAIELINQGISPGRNSK